MLALFVDAGFDNFRIIFGRRVREEVGVEETDLGVMDDVNEERVVDELPTTPYMLEAGESEPSLVVLNDFINIHLE